MTPVPMTQRAWGFQLSKRSAAERKFPGVQSLTEHFPILLLRKSDNQNGFSVFLLLPLLFITNQSSLNKHSHTHFLKSFFRYVNIVSILYISVYRH